MNTSKLAAGSNFPEVEVPDIKGGKLTLGRPEGGNDWQLVIIYRGKHCPLCTRYLGQLNDLLSQFNEIGVDLVAVSADTKEKAMAHMQHINPDFHVGYDLSIEQMQQLGLYLSNPRSPLETDRPFAEPGLFVINGEGKLQVTDISNGPFVRPELQIFLNGLKWIRSPENNYPIRGTFG